MTSLKLRELLMTMLIALGLTFGSAGVAMADWGDQRDTQDDYETVDWTSDDDDDDYDTIDWSDDDDDDDDDTDW